MIFGLGEGLHFIYWQMKSMDFVFTGGRTKPDLVYRTFATNVALELTEHQTASAKQASRRLFQSLDSGQPIMLRLDALYLDYFDIDIHFPAHYAVAAGYDENSVYLADTYRPGLQKTSRASLADARASTASLGMGRPNHQSVVLHEPGRLKARERLRRHIVCSGELRRLESFEGREDQRDRLILREYLPALFALFAGRLLMFADGADNHPPSLSTMGTKRTGRVS